MTDVFTYEKSLRSTDYFSPMLKKEVLYISDQNNGSYVGQIQIDTSSLATSSKWVDISESYLEVPFVVSMQSSTNITAANPSGFMLGLKSGSWQLIDSIQCSLNGVGVIQQTPYTNFYCGFKAMTTWSQESLQKNGDLCLFAPDIEGGSWNAGASAGGNGYANNVVAPVPAVLPIVWRTSAGTFSNTGFLRRLKLTSYPLSSLDQGYGVDGIIPSLVQQAQANFVAKNYYTDSAGVGAARVYQWVMTLTIRLKDISDFFAKLPLLRGVQLQMTLNYNSCRQTITSVAAGPTLLQDAPIMLSGRTNPMMMTSSLASNPMNLPVAGGAGGVFTVSCNVRSTVTPLSTVNPPLSACRLYIPAYIMAPEDEARYISMDRMKKIVYSDIQQYIIQSVAPGGSFNQLLTSGIPNVEQIVCMPFYNSVAGNAATIALFPYQSIFDSAPATTSPLCAITNFNVLLSASNVFQNQQLYDFQAFRDELSQANSLNGGKSDYMSSGLLSHTMWDNSYRYYVADLSRRLPAEDSIPNSVAVVGTNDTSKILDILCFLKFRRSITIDIATGAVLAS